MSSKNKTCNWKQLDKFVTIINLGTFNTGSPVFLSFVYYIGMRECQNRQKRNSKVKSFFCLFWITFCSTFCPWVSLHSWQDCSRMGQNLVHRAFFASGKAMRRMGNLVALPLASQKPWELSALPPKLCLVIAWLLLHLWGCQIPPPHPVQNSYRYSDKLCIFIYCNLLPVVHCHCECGKWNVHDSNNFE